MKVRELILELEELDPEADIYMACDPEGNSFGLLELDGVEADEAFGGGWVVFWPDGSMVAHPGEC